VVNKAPVKIGKFLPFCFPTWCFLRRQLKIAFRESNNYNYVTMSSHNHESGGGEFDSVKTFRKGFTPEVNLVVDAVTLPSHALLGILFALLPGSSVFIQSGKGDSEGGH
jgi:hypothetical protein